jgi:hypothetical protein
VKFRSSMRVSHWSILFLYLGLASVALFAFDIYFPVFVSVIFLAIITIFFIVSVQKKNIGIFMPLMWLVCGLPFIHIIPYLWLSYDDVELLGIWWGLTVNPYMQTEEVIQLTGMIGVVNGLGLAFGCSLLLRSNDKSDYPRRLTTKEITNYLPFGVWIVWVLIGVLLSWLSAPQENVFNAVYTQSESITQNLNFASAWTISYVILIFGFCDAILDNYIYRKQWKIGIFLGAISYVVIILQLLRGDRESLPLVIGLILIYFYWLPNKIPSKNINFSWIKWLAAGILLLIISMIVGVMRSELAGIDGPSSLIEKLSAGINSGALGLANLFRGTWTGVALTPLSVAGDDVYGLLPIKFGSDYWDLLASTIPGFLADAIGYSRPIDGNHGPAWEMRYGIGGTHFSVLPFMNFRMIGVFFVSGFVGYLLILLEKKALRNITVASLASLCTVVMIAPHWFWYGEKNGMNAFIIFLIILFFYRLSTSIKIQDNSIKYNSCNKGNRV